MSSHLSPRCLTWCFAPLRKAGHWLGQGARAMLLPGYCVGPRVGENLPRSLSAHGLFPFSHLCGPCLQPAGQAAGAAGPPQCPALPRLRPAAPLRGSPLPSTVCRCSCTCVACKTARMTCAASFSNCESSRYHHLSGARPLKPRPTRTHLLAETPSQVCPVPSPVYWAALRNLRRTPVTSLNLYSLIKPPPLARVPLGVPSFPYPESFPPSWSPSLPH